MKKLLLTIQIILLPIAAKANDVANTFPNEVPKADTPYLLNLVVNSILGISASIALWFLIIGGFQYVTSAGNPDSLMKAKTTIMYAIIGLITVIVSYAAVRFIINSF